MTYTFIDISIKNTRNMCVMSNSMPIYRYVDKLIKKYGGK